MGLDICVRKITKTKKGEFDYFRLVDDDGNYDRRGFPEWTKPFENEITEDWYNWELYKEETGIDIKECDWHGESYGEEGSFMTVSPKNVKVPEWDEKKYKSWEEYEEARNKVLIHIDLEKVPTYKKSIKVLYFDEVGYQRKGLNTKFYDDYNEGKIGYFVWTKEELERYKQDYCDEPYEYIFPKGEPARTINPKENFQKNIIDNFTEGEDCVIFSW